MNRITPARIRSTRLKGTWIALNFHHFHESNVSVCKYSQITHKAALIHIFFFSFVRRLSTSKLVTEKQTIKTVSIRSCLKMSNKILIL